MKFIRWFFFGETVKAETKGMKIMIQWAKKNPNGWEQIDSHDWKKLPKKEKPKKDEKGGKDDELGWIRNVSIQGITAEGFDHIAIEPITIGNDEGVKYTCWNDDPDDAHVEGFDDWVNDPQAIVWTIMPLAPDPKLGMAINTRQSCKRYAKGERYDRLLANSQQNTTVRPWTDFTPPSEEITRHGVWLDNDKFQEHLEKAPQHEWGWMHWCEHLPESETEIEDEVRHNKGQIVKRISPRKKLKEQRTQGRYRQAEHTITYYQRDSNRAVGFEAYLNEDALELTTAGAASETATTDSNLVDCFSFTTPANQPNSANWPSGGFNCQLNCTAASTGLTYGLTNTGTAGITPGFARISADLASIIERVLQSESVFSGTGLKLATTSSAISTNTPESADQVYACLVTATGDSHGDAITLQLNTTDSYADGPWTTDTGSNPGHEYTIITS